MSSSYGSSSVSKEYDGVSVLRDASILLQSGRVMSVIGENGAGKSTLMRILAGATNPSSGTLIKDGKPITLSSPRAANVSGIVMVHQELALVPGLSVADNIMLARPAGAPWGWRGSRSGRLFVTGALEAVGLDLDPATSVSDISVGQGYLVEIAKALALDAKFIIFDEPTAALSADASQVILDQIRSLRDRGCGIAFISHRLKEVRAISDEVIVMRDGRIVGHFNEVISEGDLIRLMVDRPVGMYRTERPQRRDNEVLKVEGMTTSSVSGVSLCVHEGEIVGLAGLVGSGRSEAALAIVGADSIRSGEVWIDGRPMAGKSIAAIRESGLTIVPEDRKLQGIVHGLSVHENLHIGNLAQFLRFGLIKEKELKRASENSKTLFDIRLQSLFQSIETLSGGNQQKTILARAIEAQPRVLILDEPTRGVDVKAKDEIHKLIIHLASLGTAVLLISSELEEVLALSHRIYVFAEGSVRGELDNSLSVTADEVMRLATPTTEVNGEQVA